VPGNRWVAMLRKVGVERYSVPPLAVGTQAGAIFMCRMYNQQPTNQPILLLHSTASMCMWCMRRTGVQWRHCSATTASGSMPGPRQPHSKIGGARSLPGVRPHGSCGRGAAHGLADCSVDPRLDPVGNQSAIRSRYAHTLRELPADLSTPGMPACRQARIVHG